LKNTRSELCCEQCLSSAAGRVKQRRIEPRHQKTTDLSNCEQRTSMFIVLKRAWQRVDGVARVSGIGMWCAVAAYGLCYVYIARMPLVCVSALTDCFSVSCRGTDAFGRHSSLQTTDLEYAKQNRTTESFHGLRW
jgi:hypothetical protein